MRGWIHLGAAVVAVPAGAVLIARSVGSGASSSVAVYSVGMLALFAVSAGYHLVPMSAGPRRVMQRADHATIFVFIAACYTPWCVLVVSGVLGEVLLGVAWAGAAAGVVGKLVGFDRFRALTGALYLVLGWVGLIALPDAFRVLSPSELGLTWSFALLYTLGAFVLSRHWPDPVPDTFGYHEVWHSMVVAAAACYWLVVWSLLGQVH